MRISIASIVLVGLVFGPFAVHPDDIDINSPLSAAKAAKLSSDDEALLEDLERRAFLYFWEQQDPRSGLVGDRARSDGSPTDETHRDVASIAATGFGLTALCIAAQRKWMHSEAVRERVRTTVEFFATRATEVHGWFYHWMNARTGERVWQSEVSSIDTALLLGGVLAARGYYGAGSDIGRLCSGIYDRVDFKWMLNGDPTLLSHGWKPESGFLKSRWDRYDEESILYLLAIGSRTHPISPASWYAWKRDPITYHGFSYVGDGPLFTHQFSQAWIDFRGLKEPRLPFTDYFANSAIATLANRQFCVDLSPEFPGYTKDIWGITASDSVKGYVAWGGPPRHPAIDGTVVPCAAAGSLMFTPDICLPAVKAMRQRYGDRIYGRYGFADAFNPGTGWVDTDVIGIDIGITLVSAENLRTAHVWEWVSRNPEPGRALTLAGFRRSLRAAGPPPAPIHRLECSMPVRSSAFRRPAAGLAASLNSLATVAAEPQPQLQGFGKPASGLPKKALVRQPSLSQPPS